MKNPCFCFDKKGLGFIFDYSSDEKAIKALNLDKQPVDSRDNMLDTEALYVVALILGNGSYVDLNGTKLY